MVWGVMFEWEDKYCINSDLVELWSTKEKAEVACNIRNRGYSIKKPYSVKEWEVKE